MRLWHYKLIPFLPKSQLLAQWRELNCLFKKQPKHILINYVYEYPKRNLYYYTSLVLDEMKKRGYKTKKDVISIGYFLGMEWHDYQFAPNNFPNKNPFPQHHNARYFEQCFYNLEEKYDRGQKDFTKEQYEALAAFCSEQMLKYLMFN